MKTTLKNLSRGGQLYEAPALEVIELAAEGVLCASFTGNSIDDADELDWDTL